MSTLYSPSLLQLITVLHWFSTFTKSEVHLLTSSVK